MHKELTPREMNLEEFKEFAQSIQEEVETIKNAKFIPFINLGMRPKSNKVEKQCVQLILEDIHSLPEYTATRMKPGETFFMVDMEFWVTWVKLIEREEIPDLCIDHTNLVEYLNKPRKGLVYLQDYVLLTYQLYKLFSSWYKTEGKPVKLAVGSVGSKVE